MLEEPAGEGNLYPPGHSSRSTYPATVERWTYGLDLSVRPPWNSGLHHLATWPTVGSSPAGLEGGLQCGLQLGPSASAQRRLASSSPTATAPAPASRHLQSPALPHPSREICIPLGQCIQCKGTVRREIGNHRILFGSVLCCCLPISLITKPLASLHRTHAAQLGAALGDGRGKTVRRSLLGHICGGRHRVAGAAR